MTPDTLANRIMSMPPNARGRSALAALAREMTTERLRAEVAAQERLTDWLAAEVERAVSTDPTFAATGGLAL